MDLDTDFSCDGFIPTDTTSSLQIGMAYEPCPRSQPFAVHSQSKSPIHSSEEKCASGILSSSSSSTLSSALFAQDCRMQKLPPPRAPNIDYELSVAKSIMQQYSSISGDNLFDHLSDIIKRIIDERPPNVIDFFEEFSRKVREQKLHSPEQFSPDGVYEVPRLYNIAKKQLMSMKLPYSIDQDGAEMEEDLDESEEDRNKLQLKREPFMGLPIFYDRVQHLQFYWNQCGFSIASEDIFQLACSMDRLQTHPSIKQCRFWGMINGLKASYYIVEAYLTNEEITARFLQMKEEILESQWKIPEVQIKLPSHIGPELTPGTMGWENYPAEELAKMKPDVLPVPTVQLEEQFDVPPEPIGRGVNRYSYFVVNRLSDEWIELPICTPKQLKIARQIKKFFTGDLESDFVSYPCFPGKEKHYLRAMISRITAGTYIAPRGYYRTMTKSEKRMFEGRLDDEIGEEEEEEDENDNTLLGEGEEESEEGEQDNDIVLLKNEKYIPQSLASLKHTSKWVHIRPNILRQGRVVWFDEEKARRERQRELKRLEKLRRHQEMALEDNEEEETGESEDEEESEVGEEEEYRKDVQLLEKGPAILSSCSRDLHDDMSVPWVARYTSNYTNKNERILVMRSNMWPGAYSFVYEQLCDSIYLGWGHKYVARNMNWPHIPLVSEEYPHGCNDFVEIDDPSVELEEAYRLSLLKKELKLANIGENLSEYENETHESSDDEDEDEDEEEEEEEEE